MDMVLTTEQVSQRTNLTPRQVRNLLIAGIIPGFKRGIRSWGVMLADFEKWLKARQRAGAK